ncbi:MAG: ABC transporter ATP-binding protein [Pseudomonadota bacterium]
MTAIQLYQVSKTYALYRHGTDRLQEIVTGRKRHVDFTALHPLSLEIEEGEVIGLVGMNGAGKSTLLKMLAGTLAPSSGTLAVHGRVSALLELGAGFHPEMSGRDNVRLSCAVMGMRQTQIDELYPRIVEFAGIRDFMDQPVKTYSSGMFVRLAFAVATSVEPDILIVDEALSVGDGAFARKSFDRIMGFKKTGKTILFCSHSLYQVEAICTRVIWMHQGRMMMDGDPAQVIAAYNAFLGGQSAQDEQLRPVDAEALDQATSHGLSTRGHARLERVSVSVDGITGLELEGWCGASDVSIEVTFSSDPQLPAPTIGIAIAGSDGRFVCSAGTHNDGQSLIRDEYGKGKVTLTYPALPLLKGHYWVNAFLLCENAVHIYDQANSVAELVFKQRDMQQGIVSLPHRWGIEER